MEQDRTGQDRTKRSATHMPRQTREQDADTAKPEAATLAVAKPRGSKTAQESKRTALAPAWAVAALLPRARRDEERWERAFVAVEAAVAQAAATARTARVAAAGRETVVAAEAAATAVAAASARENERERTRERGREGGREEKRGRGGKEEEGGGDIGRQEWGEGN